MGEKEAADKLVKEKAEAAKKAAEEKAAAEKLAEEEAAAAKKAAEEKAAAEKLAEEEAAAAKKAADEKAKNSNFLAVVPEKEAVSAGPTDVDTQAPTVEDKKSEKDSQQDANTDD